MNNRMSRILFIADSLSYGGAEKMLCCVANGLAEKGNHVIVINMMEHPDNAGRLNEDIQVINIQPIKIRYLDRVDQILKLVKSVKKCKPDIIIAFKFFSNYMAAIAGRILSLPVIISERCDPSRECVLTGRARLYWNIINAADGGVFQTQEAMRYYSAGMQKRGTVIPNPALLKEDITHTVRTNEESGTVVSVGRLSNIQKRYDIMLQAFQLFSQNHPEYTLKIYGDGEDGDTIRQWISEYGLDDTARLMGRTEHPLQAMDEADIFLTTSDYEGISNSLLEAMAIGMPVIATDCTPGGARLLIKNGQNGILVPCGDTSAVSQALNKLADDYLLRREYGMMARNVRKEYNIENIIGMWSDYKDRVLQDYQSGKHKR